jgi:DNA-nicking Smr family endonuclease
VAARGPRGPRDLTPEDRRIWGRVTGTVTPPTTRKAARVTPGTATAEVAPPSPSRPPPKFVRPAPAAPAAVPRPPPGPTRPRAAPDELEPRRQRRLARERDPIEARIDLHGYGRFQAQDALTAFLHGAQARGYRAVLVITGQGRRGGSGVIRASVHEWLHGPALRGVVSGFAPAHRRHGGEGAIYVTIRRA